MINAGFTTIEQYRDVEVIGHSAEAIAHGADPTALLAAFGSHGRDNARTPIPWTGAEHGGFTTGTPWLPVNANHNTINAVAAIESPDSVFHHYRKLIELRHHDRTVAYGDYHPVLIDHPHLFAFTRSLDDDTLLVLGSFTDHQLVVELPDHVWVDTAELVLCSHVDPADPPAHGRLTLQAWESRIYRRR